MLLFKGTTLVGTGDSNVLDHFDRFMFNGTRVYPHPDLSQAPHSPKPTPTQSHDELFSLLSSQSYRSRFPGSLGSPYLAPKPSEEPYSGITIPSATARFHSAFP